MTVAQGRPPLHSIDATMAAAGGLFLLADLRTQGPGPWAEVPHRHDFVELAWLSAGSGRHVIDFQEHTAEPGDLFIVAAGQMHHWERGEVETDGALVLFRPELLLGRGGPGEWAPLSGKWHPDPASAARIDALLAQLDVEQRQRAPGHELAIRSLLTALLVLCGRYVSSGTVADGLAAQFERLARESRGTLRTVAECARELSVTPGHLSEVVSTATGRPPGEILREAVVHEAQRLLARSDFSCAQIARELGFDDASYFSRFFRREVGMTPSRFRDLQRDHISAA
ncbi:helix-turn-helix domain-containing protein [Microbacterium sp. OVT16B]|uniref:helix-turn-helix domain-containing protein n=1 Tax=Microbacterium sp. OVT16B TaxID=2862682 RepID=UPI001CBBA526|nr:helix-turn-helix domain-containing protein [Microbacterium sp. OVT16B]